MTQRYNIALVPLKKNNQIIRLADNFAALSYRYLLGEKSLPHVTICQFLANENELERIWVETCKVVKVPRVKLTFAKFSCTQGTNADWISLLPDKVAWLNEMHRVVMGLVEKPVGNVAEKYDPHLTLVDTVNSLHRTKVAEVAEMYRPITDVFEWVLGQSDSVGQLTRILFKGD